MHKKGMEFEKFDSFCLVELKFCVDIQDFHQNFQCFTHVQTL